MSSSATAVNTENDEILEDDTDAPVSFVDYVGETGETIMEVEISANSENHVPNVDFDAAQLQMYELQTLDMTATSAQLIPNNDNQTTVTSEESDEDNGDLNAEDSGDSDYVPESEDDDDHAYHNDDDDRNDNTQDDDVDDNNADNEDDDNNDGPPPKKRIRKSHDKMQRDQDQHGMKEPCPGTCSKKCTANIDQTRRQEIWASFWSLEYNQRKQWLYHTIDKSTKASTKGEHVSRRDYTYKYRFSDSNGTTHCVCKTFFLTTLGFDKKNDKAVTTALKTANAAITSRNDARGRHEPKNKIDR